MNTVLQDLKLAHTVDLTAVVDTTQAVSFGFQTYFDIGSNASNVHYADKGSLFLRVFCVRADGRKVVVYDSNTNYPHGVRNTGTEGFFAADFFYVNDSTQGADPKTINYAQAISNIGLNVLCSATTTGEGVGIEGAFYNKKTSILNRTNYILLEHTFVMSQELAELFTPASVVELETEEKSGFFLSLTGLSNYLFLSK